MMDVEIDIESENNAEGVLSLLNNSNRHENENEQFNIISEEIKEEEKVN
jgi:hypothetical protein